MSLGRLCVRLSRHIGGSLLQSMVSWFALPLSTSNGLQALNELRQRLIITENDLRALYDFLVASDHYVMCGIIDEYMMNEVGDKSWVSAASYAPGTSAGTVATLWRVSQSQPKLNDNNDNKPEDQPTTSVVHYTAIPYLDFNFVERSEGEQVMKALLSASKAKTEKTTVLIYGVGGSGKSSIANHLGKDNEIKAAFTSGIYWIELPEPSTADAIAKAIWAILPADPNAKEFNQVVLQQRLETLVQRGSLLLIVDNVTTPAQLKDLRSYYRGCILATARTADALKDLNDDSIEKVQLSGFTMAQAVLALKDHGRPRPRTTVNPDSATFSVEVQVYSVDDEKAILNIAKFCNCFPLSLRILGSYKANNPQFSWREVDNAMKNLNPNDPLNSILKSTLNAMARDTVRAPAVKRLLQMSAFALNATDGPIGLLSASGFLNRESDGKVTLHDHIYDFLAENYAQERTRHLWSLVMTYLNRKSSNTQQFETHDTVNFADIAKLLPPMARDSAYERTIGILVWSDLGGLETPGADALAMKHLLAHLGFSEFFTFGTCVLPNGEMPQRKPHELLRFIRSGKMGIKDNDLVVFYYAGHATEMTMAPVLRFVDYLDHDDDSAAANFTNPTAQEVVLHLTDCGAAHVVVMLDCCYAGRVFSIMEKTVTHEVGKPRGPEPLQEEAEQQLYPRITPLQRAQQIVGVSPTKNVSFAGRRAVYVMAAASATEKVFERAGANRENSQFVDAFMKVVKNPKLHRNDNGIVLIDSIAAYMNTQMPIQTLTCGYFNRNVDFADNLFNRVVMRVLSDAELADTSDLTANDDFLGLTGKQLTINWDILPDDGICYEHLADYLTELNIKYSELVERPKRRVKAADPAPEVPQQHPANTSPGAAQPDVIGIGASITFAPDDNVVTHPSLSALERRIGEHEAQTGAKLNAILDILKDLHQKK